MDTIAPVSEANTNLSRDVAVSAGYMILARLSVRAMGIVSSLVLARLLVPADFGLVGLAMMVLGTLDVLTDTSITVVLIQSGPLERRHYDTAWTLTVLRGLLVGVFMIATAGLQARLFHDARISRIMWVLALTFAVQSFQNIRLTDFQRELQFGRLFPLMMAERIAAFFVAMTICLVFRNFWALILGNLAGKLLTLPYGYWLVPYRPRISFAYWREFFKFTRWLRINNIFTVLENQVPTLVIGMDSGIAAVGRYQMAAQLATLPASEIAAPIRPPAYSGLARLRDDLPALRRQLLDQLGLVLAIITPLSFGICVSAPWVVKVALGRQWTDAVPLLQFLAVGTCLDALAHHLQMVFLVVQRQRVYALVGMSVVSLKVVAIVILGRYGGINWVTGCIAAAAAVSLVMSIRLAVPILEVTRREILHSTARTLTALAIMSAAVVAVRQYWPISDDVFNATLQLFAVIALGGSLYIGSLLGLWVLSGRPAGAERQVFDGLGGIVKRLMPWANFGARRRSPAVPAPSLGGHGGAARPGIGPAGGHTGGHNLPGRAGSKNLVAPRGENVILVLGAARSGTTWLAKIFDSHPDVVYRHEPDTILRTADIPTFCAIEDVPIYRDHAREYLENLANLRSLKSAGSRPFFSKHYRSGISDGLRNGLIHGLHLAASAPFGAERLRRFPVPDFAEFDPSSPPPVVIKSVSSLGRARLFAEAMPGCRIIVIVRHPCGQVLSMMRGVALQKFEQSLGSGAMLLDWAPRLGLTAEQVASFATIEQFAWNWAVLNQKALDDLEGMARVKILQYRDLCAAPVAVARELFEFTDLAWSPQTESFVRESSTYEGPDRYYKVMKNSVASANKWRTELSGEDQRRIVDIAMQVPAGRMFLS